MDGSVSTGVRRQKNYVPSLTRPLVMRLPQIGSTRFVTWLRQTKGPIDLFTRLLPFPLRMRNQNSSSSHCITLGFLSCVTFGIGLFLGTIANAADLEFRVTDADSEPMPCRIHLQDSSGKPVAVQGYPFWRDHFVCEGDATVEVPNGEYRWTIERGPEFERQQGTVILEGQQAVVEASLKRISNLREQGWYSADMHVHRAAKDVPLLMRAEDLDFAPVIDWWNRPAKDGVPLEPIDYQFDGHRVFTLRAGEDEREGGALLYIGLNQPLDLSVQSREFPSPIRFVDQARAINSEVWIDIEKPFWWDVPTWLASGKMNSIGLANNHMCRSRMLENEAWGRPRDVRRLPNPLGNGYWTQEIYYHLLNAGIRLPPSAGSASGVLPNPVGYNRVYAYLGDQEFTREQFFDRVSTGRVFVTNGPILKVKANGTFPGSTFDFHGDAKTIQLEIELTSQDPISAIDIVHNGKIVKRVPCKRGIAQKMSVDLLVDGPGWFLVRAITDVEHTFRFASTAPWFVLSPSRDMPVDLRSVEFFSQWVDQRIQRIRDSVRDPDQRQLVLKPHLEAKLFWQRRAGNQASKSTAVDAVESQPMLASIRRLIDAMDYIGNPLPKETVNRLRALSGSDREITRQIQEILDPRCFAELSVKKDGVSDVRVINHEPELLEQGWRTFLVKVINKPGNTGRLLIRSPNAEPIPHSLPAQVESRWMQLSTFEGRPLKSHLSGLELEYRIIQIYSRDPGKKRGWLEFQVTGDTHSESTIRRWRFDQDADGWREMNDIAIEVGEGSMHITASSNDPFMGATVEDIQGPKVLRFWAHTDENSAAQLFWWTKEKPRPDGQRRIDIILQPGRGQLYEVPFRVEGELAGVRLDPLTKPGKIRIDWIDLHRADEADNWAMLPVVFDCQPATKVTFHIEDQQGLPAFAKFEIRDSNGQVYPAQTKRLAPDFFFHSQIYRGDGESISLPPGEYVVQCSRGPESIEEEKRITVGIKPTDLSYHVKRWVDPSKHGWWSGDHHIHAAGCRHYENPTQGVEPSDMIRHIMGEDLKVGCCLTWGPCFDYQKRFFTGAVAEQSRYPYTLRYDVEVSGFGSHRSGHLNLLNLTQQIYPGGESKDHWPTLGLNTLRWAKRQGAICGPAHSSIGLTRFVGRVPGTEGKDGPNSLPNFNIPVYDGIGANEFVVDVTHRVPGADGEPVPAVDFISTMNTNRVAEWNMWYHVLNCGFRVAASGETDFPCVSGDRVGLGRVYAQVDGELTFAKWVQAVGDGRSYVSDGTCHLMNFSASTGSDTVLLGQSGSELRVASGESASFDVLVASRQPGSEDVSIELIVNGYPVGTRVVPSDGKEHSIEFDHTFDQSSWVAIRAFPSAHTNPIYVRVDGEPVRGPIDSVKWCLAGVEQCWRSKQSTYSDDEQEDARKAYQHARTVYSTLLEKYDSR